MRVSSIYASKDKTVFGRALTSQEEIDFKKTTNEAMKELGVDKGIRLFKVFQTSLPTEYGQNLGVGKLNSTEAIDYLKFMALYTGSNAIKIYPTGQFASKLRFNNYYCPYERSSTAIGEDNINFHKLTKPEYGRLLTDSDIKPYLISDKKDSVDYENELDPDTGAAFKLIKKAYNNMMSAPNLTALAMKRDFFKFKDSLKSDTYDRLAIAPYVKDSDPDLFKGFSSSLEKKERFETYKHKYSEEIDVFKFGKFLALKNLQEAKEKLKKDKLELYGDCPIGFTKDEVFSFPDAFYPENITPGWGFRAIKYEDIPKEGTEANRLFTEKISGLLENFDGIRFDVGWQYFKPKLSKYDENGNPSRYKISVGNKIINHIEKTALRIKGKKYDTKKLIYECDASPEDFSMFKWDNGVPLVNKGLSGRTCAVTSVYEHANWIGWGNPQFYNRSGLNSYIIGTNNHDSTPLRVLAEQDIDNRGDADISLSNIRKDNVKALRKSLKVTPEWISKPKNFINAKFAELFQAKNHFIFFNDAIGNDKRVAQENIDPQNYRYKIGHDYERQYHRMLQKGYGFNLAEVLRIAMKAKDMDITNPTLYKKIANYSRILSAKGPETKVESERMNYLKQNNMI
ncbi:4-alpha-glucanotransferase [bacterium]|nr:4-alpha-glucanotransferase [bacterium]